MQIISKVGIALQQVFGKMAEEVAVSTKVIVRRRKFSPVSLAQTFVLGFLQNPRASDEQLAQMAVQCGAAVTPQAVEQRHTPQLVGFLEGLFREAVTLVVGSAQQLAPVLERFTAVKVLDSSTLTLPNSMQQQFRGCGGSYGSGVAALKLQTELDLRSGALTHIQIEPGRSPDSATSRQQAEHLPGTLRITDLGYFNVPVFASMVRATLHFLSRLQFGVGVARHDGETVGDILAWLSKQPGPIVDGWIFLGKKERLPCRLIAWRLPQEQADRRRQKLRTLALQKRGQEPTAERMAWCDWSILVTSVPAEMLSATEAIILYRARWQIELLFKRWKSQGLVAELSGSTDVRQMVRVWARLLAAVVQHWLLVACSWGDPNQSWVKVSNAIRTFVGRLVATFDRQDELERVLADLAQVVAKTCRRNKRKKTGAAEMLNDATRLNLHLT
jgi:hypothetical protein